PVYFRRARSGQEIKLGTLTHDLMNQFVLLRMLKTESPFNQGYYQYIGIVTEPEVRRIFGGNHRHADGVLVGPSENNESYIRSGVELEL
ncbi:MAG: hypothetical protein WA981_03495, partial [Glaciecola sp.]